MSYETAFATVFIVGIGLGILAVKFKWKIVDKL